MTEVKLKMKKQVKIGWLVVEKEKGKQEKERAIGAAREGKEEIMGEGIKGQ